MDFQKIDKKKLAKILIGAGIIILVFLIYLLPIRVAHGWDETVYLQNAETIFFGATNYNELSFRPPLLSVIFGLSFMLWHSHVFASILTAAINALAVLFIFLIGKKIYNEKVGLVAAMIVGFSPFLIQSANYLLTDVPVMSLMTIAFYFSLFKDRKWPLFFSGVFVSLAVLMKFDAVLFAPVILLALIIKKTRLRNILFFCAGGLITILPYLIWSQIAYGNFLYPFIYGASFVSVPTASNLLYLQNISTPFTILVPIGIVLFMIFSIIKFAKKKELFSKEEWVLLLWIAVFMAFFLYTPHKFLRYVFPIGPPLALLASRGFFHVPEKTPKKIRKTLSAIITIGIPIAMIITAIIWHSYSYGASLIDNNRDTNYKNVTDYITNNLNYNGTLYVFTEDPWPVFAYYTGLNTSVISWAWHDIPVFEEKYNSHIRDGGLVIINNESEWSPAPSWFDSNSQFALLGSYGNYSFYKYN